MTTDPYSRRRGRLGAALVTALAATGIATFAGPAAADPGTPLGPGLAGATLSGPDTVIQGNTIHVEGEGWTDGSPSGGTDDGSWIAIKLGAAGGVEAGILNTEPTSQFEFTPGGGGVAGLWYGAIADDDGGFSIDVPFPTASNTNPALGDTWDVGEVHHLQLLTGSMKSGGDTPRSVYLTFTIDNGVLVTASNGGRGAPAARVTLTASASAGTFTASAPVTATVDGVGKSFTSGGTANATGGLGNSTLVFDPGTLRAGAHTVELTDGTHTYIETVSTVPAAAFPALAQGGAGTVTLSNLPNGASVASVQFSDAVFTDLPALADSSGVATFGIEVPDTAALGTFPVTVTLADSTQYTLPSQKVSPSTATFGDDVFSVAASPETFVQGFYQSAYSAASGALFVSAAAGTNAAEAGAVYKVDPNTLAVIDSLTDLPASSSVGGELGAYGIGVDDVHGTVWVTSTRKAAVYVLDQDDLSILKVFPEGTLSHGRDVVYDPTSNRVFAVSASEGSSGSGYISVFEADDEDGDGTKYEKITDIQTGLRSVYSPMSLELGQPGTLYSPSLTSDKVAVVDTQNLTFEYLTLPGIDVGGRGASGVAYDPATNRLFVASQNSDELLIADAATGATVAEVPTGAGALNVAFDQVTGLAYVANFTGSTVSVIDVDGNHVANLPIARGNHVHEDGLGNVFVVDKATPNKLWKVRYLGEPEVTVTPSAQVGSTLHVEGTGFVHPTSGGSTVAIKIDDGAYSRLDASLHTNQTIWATVEADASGSFSVDLQLPDGTTSGANGSTPAFTAGDHTLRFLTGTLKAGDATRSLSAGFEATATPVIAPLEPGRYWDTRDEPTFDGQFRNTGRLAAGTSYRVQIAGRGELPADAVGVVANLAVINPAAAGFATIHPCVEGTPTTSTVNYQAGEVLANNVVVPLDADGAVCVYTLADADFALDVNGFVTADSPQVGITPTRFADTRDTGTLAAGSVLTVDIAGSDLVPDDAQAALVNITAVTPSADGYLTAYPCDAPQVPTASTVNYLAGQFVPNGAIVDLSADGKLCVFTLSPVDVLVDVTGYVPAGVETITPLTPGRLFDSRAGQPLIDGTATGPRLTGGQWVEVDVAGRHGIPDTATAAFFNVAVVYPDGPGFVALSPAGGAGAPQASNLNHATGGVVRANNAVTQLSDTGSVWIYTLSGADLILDVTGFVE